MYLRLLRVPHDLKLIRSHEFYQDMLSTTTTTVVCCEFVTAESSNAPFVSASDSYGRAHRPFLSSIAQQHDDASPVDEAALNALAVFVVNNISHQSRIFTRVAGERLAKYMISITVETLW